MTLIDYNVFDKLDDLLILSSDCLKEFPPLQAFHTRMANRPKLKAYREKEDFKQLPIVTPPMGYIAFGLYVGVWVTGWLGWAVVLGSFQCRGVLLLLHIVGQEPAVLAAGAGREGYIFIFFSFIFPF